MNVHDDRIVATSEYASTQVDGEEIILNLEDGVYYGLNEVGAKVWELIQEEKHVSDVCRQIQEEYDVDEETCRTDVVRLIEELREIGLVRLVADDSEET